MLRITALVLVFASISLAYPFVDFQPCDNTKPTPQLVEIDACPSRDCTLTRGTSYDVKVSFVSPVDADQVFNMTGKLACDHGIVCPVFKGGYCMYTHPWTPMDFTGSSMTQFSLVDEKQNTLVCFNMPMTE
ncbi:NPC intracellular cholesterol transporter 2-like [Brevipalpus obovatus]|uniref:NPC intracellular cholesterol transporter 2-like n=1 Tax=Brevipalpus obovatus TaxID=246614 RepID=UPI003D9E1872